MLGSGGLWNDGEGMTEGRLLPPLANYFYDRGDLFSLLLFTHDESIPVNMADASDTLMIPAHVS